MTPPAYSVPAFTSSTVALNAAVTDVRICSTASTAETNKPFTFAQPFKKGDLAPGDFLAGRIAGEADLPLQFNVKATHPDGSVRHAIISGVLPVLGAGAVKTMALIRSAAGASTTPAASSTLTAGGFSALASLTIGGADYTASPAAALAANIAASKAWRAGEIATEFSVMAPVIATADGATHPLLEVQFNTCRFAGSNAVKVDITIEHTDPYNAIADIAYTGSISIAGAQVYTFDVVHAPCGRWKKTFWWNNANPLYVKHNIAYLIGSKQIPNYDQSVVMNESTLAGYATKLADTTLFKPMGSGPFTPAFPGTGGRPDIGLLHGWAAAAVLSMDKRALDITHAGADQGGSWRAHMRDKSNGPGKGMPQSAINWPTVTEFGTLGDSLNYSTSEYEKWPGRDSANKNVFVHDESHQPNIAYLSYLLTGDNYYLEEMQFWGVWIVNVYNPGYRLEERGLLRKTQTRGQAWGLRNIGECAALTPDTHPLKSHFKYWVDQNLENYNANYTDNADANVLGVLDAVDDRQYWGFGNKPGARNGVGNFQDDFFTSVAGHLNELGFSEAGRLLQWKARYPTGRLIGEGMCYNHAALQCWRISDDNMTPVYPTFGQCLNGTVGSRIDGSGVITAEVLAAPCNSQQRMDLLTATVTEPMNPFIVGEITGFSYGTEGYPACMQPAIALAVDSGYTDADLAWDLFESRTVKPDYGVSPQFAIVPRGFVPDVEPDPDPTPTPPNNGEKMNFNRVKTVTTSTGTGNITTGAAAARCKPLSSIPINTKVTMHIEDEAGADWELSECTVTGASTFSRDTVLDGSNYPSKTNFGAGTKTVFCTTSAAYLNGQRAEDLADTAPTSSHKLLMLDANGNAYTVLVSALQTLFGSTPAPADTTAPVLSSPTGASTGTTTASGSVVTDEGNGTIYCLASANASETAATVKSSGTTQAISSTGSKVVSVTGLSSATTYYLHFVHRDAAGNDSARVSSASFTTAAAGDTTAPTLSSPTGTQTGQTTATGTVSTNEANGTLYRYVSTNAVESAATVKAENLTQAVTATGVQNVSATGLTSATTYYWHFLHRDAAGNDSTVASSASFTTQSAGTTYTYSRYNGDGQTSSLVGQPVTRASSNSGTYDGYIAFAPNVGINETYFGVSPAPASCLIGWGSSATTEPGTFSSPTDAGLKNPGGGMTPGSMGNTFSGGQLVSDPGYMWIPTANGTYNRYLWLKPINGAAVCLNPSSPCVVTLS